MPPWQQLHPSSSSSGLTSGIGSSATASSNSGSSSPRIVGTSSPADSSSGGTTNLLMDSTNTNCNGNDKTSGKSSTRTK